jgi:hypothetical protein
MSSCNHAPSVGASGVRRTGHGRCEYFFVANGIPSRIKGSFQYVHDLCRELHKKMGPLSTSIATVGVSVRRPDGEYVAVAKDRLCTEVIPIQATHPLSSPTTSVLRVTYLEPDPVSLRRARRHPLTSRAAGSSAASPNAEREGPATPSAASSAPDAANDLKDTVAAALRSSTTAAAKQSDDGVRHETLVFFAKRVTELLVAAHNALAHDPNMLDAAIATGDQPEWVVVDIPADLTDEKDSKSVRCVTMPALPKADAHSTLAVRAHLKRHLAPMTVPLPIFFFDRQQHEWAPLTDSTIGQLSPVFVVQSYKHANTSGGVPAAPRNAESKSPSAPIAVPPAALRRSDPPAAPRHAVTNVLGSHRPRLPGTLQPRVGHCPPTSRAERKLLTHVLKCSCEIPREKDLLKNFVLQLVKEAAGQASLANSRPSSGAAAPVAPVARRRRSRRLSPITSEAMYGPRPPATADCGTQLTTPTSDTGTPPS